MEIVFGLVLLVMGWITLLLSWVLWEQKFVSVALAVFSMVLFFAAAGSMVYVTQGYAIYDATAGAIVTGEYHLTSYQPYGMLFTFFGVFSMVWVFVRVWDFIMEALLRKGWLYQV